MAVDANPTKRRKTDSFSGSVDAYGSESAAASGGTLRPSTLILETAELLRQSRVDYSRLLPEHDKLLRKVKSVIEALETHDPVLIGNATRGFEKQHPIRIPYPKPRPADDSQLKVSMEKPSHCNVVGSFVLQTMVRSQNSFSIDMIVEMPRSLFQEKDYLNLRYFYKRAYYLAHIARALSAALPHELELSFANFGGNELLPVLMATPVRKAMAEGIARTESKNSCRIQVIPCLGANVFPAQKLVGSKNCLRPDVAATTTGSNDKDYEKKSPLLPATPFYNATIKADAAYVPYLKFLHQTQKACPAFLDACLLGRVWLQQRGFGSSLDRGGFGAFEWAVLVALLMKTGSKKRSHGAYTTVLSESLSSMQIFKAVVQFLAATDLRSGRPCILGQGFGDGRNNSSLDTLREGGTPVLYDSERQVNVGYKMSSWSATLLRQCARRTHELLKDESATADHFMQTFISKTCNALEDFDLVFRVSYHEENHISISTSGVATCRGALWDFGHSVYQTLKKALGDRAKLVHVQLPRSREWALIDNKASGFNTGVSYLTVGIVFDAANMARQIDHGPSAEDKKEARKFREFWGDRAELRRFQNGSIEETLVWTAQGPTALCEEISRYILGYQLRLNDEGHDIVVLGGDSFTSLVPLQYTADKAAFTAAQQAFAVFEQDVRGLDETALPLHVRQVAAIVPELRWTSLRAPQLSRTSILYPMEAVLFFEASGKWPDDLEAIGQAKVAFLLRVGEALEGVRAGIETRVGLEGCGTSSAPDAFLDIVYRQVPGTAGGRMGEVAFRLRIHSDLEMAILRRQVHDKTLEAGKRAVSAERLAAHRQLFLVRPRQNQLMTTMSMRLPAFSGAVRLVKRWFSAHKLSSHFSDEFLELLVLYVFIHTGRLGPSGQPPASPTPALLRTLQFLARWDWRTEPLVVETDDGRDETEADGLPSLASSWAEDSAGTVSVGVAAATTADARTRLAAWRKIDPHMNHTVLFVAATHEASGTAFTTSNYSTGSNGQQHPMPSRAVASRMTSLARAACRLVKEHGDQADSVLDASLLFQPSLRDYDVLIHLSRRVIKQLVRNEIEPGAEGDDEDRGKEDDAHSRTASNRRRSIYKNLDSRVVREIQPLPRHPAQLLVDKLNEVYGWGSSGGGTFGSGGRGGSSVSHTVPIVFFQGSPDDDHEGEFYVIGAMWNQYVQPRPFRATLSGSFRPVSKCKTKKGGGLDDGEEVEEANENDDMVEVNREGILGEITRIGGAMIEQIEVKKS